LSLPSFMDSLTAPVSTPYPFKYPFTELPCSYLCHWILHGVSRPFTGGSWVRILRSFQRIVPLLTPYGRARMGFSYLFFSFGMLSFSPIAGAIMGPRYQWNKAIAFHGVSLFLISILRAMLLTCLLQTCLIVASVILILIRMAVAKQRGTWKV
jgi:hypothetical protein